MTLSQVRLIKDTDKVYWAELINYPADYQVKHGYYLASYWGLDGIVHLVSLGDVTSCVVRHLKDDNVFISEQTAQQKADELSRNSKE